MGKAHTDYGKRNSDGAKLVEAMDNAKTRITSRCLPDIRSQLQRIKQMRENDAQLANRHLDPSDISIENASLNDLKTELNAIVAEIDAIIAL